MLNYNSIRVKLWQLKVHIGHKISLKLLFPMSDVPWCDGFVASRIKYLNQSLTRHEQSNLIRSWMMPVVSQLELACLSLLYSTLFQVKLRAGLWPMMLGCVRTLVIIFTNFSICSLQWSICSLPGLNTACLSPLNLKGGMHHICVPPLPIQLLSTWEKMLWQCPYKFRQNPLLTKVLITKILEPWDYIPFFICNGTPPPLAKCLTFKQATWRTSSTKQVACIT